MSITVPTIPFAEASICNSRTHNVISTMTEEQCRYALWAALVILFGSSVSNATEVMLNMAVNDGLCEKLPVAEAQMILTEIGIGRESPVLVTSMKYALEKKRQETE